MFPTVSLTRLLVAAGLAASMLAATSCSASAPVVNADAPGETTESSTTTPDSDSEVEANPESRPTVTDSAAEPSEEPPGAPEPSAPDALLAESSAELGGGTITLDGVDYVFEAEFCANDEDGIFNQGAGVTPSGQPFTGGIIAQPLQDGYIVTVELSLGRQSIYAAPLVDQPSYEANSFNDSELDFTIEGTRVYGTAAATDLQEVALANGETVSIAFDGQCGDLTAPGADSDQQESGSNYCALAQEEVDIATAFANNFDVTSEEFEQYLANALDLASRIERPAEIAEQLDLVHAELRTADEAAAGVGYDFVASFGDMVATLGSPDSIAAGLVIEDYNERVCGIDGPNQ